MNGDDEEEDIGRSRGVPVTYRTRPGAPPSAAQTRSSLTPQNQWANMFASTPGSTYVSSFNRSTAASQVLNVLDEALRDTPFNFGSLTTPKSPFNMTAINQPPPLLAAPQGHAQQWMGASAYQSPSQTMATGIRRVMPYVDVNRPMSTRYGAKPEEDKYAWGSAYR